MHIPGHIKNRLLQDKLENLIKHAKDNEKKHEQCETFGFEIIDADSPTELRYLLLSRLRARFQLQEVVLCLIDQHYDIERVFLSHEEKSRINYEDRLLVLNPAKDSECIVSLNKTSVTGMKAIKKYHWMIARLKNRNHFKSAVYLPLMRGKRIIGALLLLSYDENRFPDGVGTFFLQKVSTMSAVAIENCLNQQRLKEISYQDVLTQVYNRRYFDLRLKDEIARSLRCGDDLVCMFLDVDYFKRINDTYGHQTGDDVLVRVANQIKNQVRVCDIVARYGGEEFVVVLPSTPLQAAQEIAERLRQGICADSHRYQEKEFHVSISIGMANLKGLDKIQQRSKQDYETIGANLLSRADEALYQSKEGGRNRVTVFVASETEL